MWIHNDSYSWWWDLLRIFSESLCHGQLPTSSIFQPGPPELALLEDHLRQLQVINTDMWLITSGEIKSKSGHTWETWKTTQQNTTYFGWQKFYGNGPASGWPFTVYHSHLTASQAEMSTSNGYGPTELKVGGFLFFFGGFWRRYYLNLFKYVDYNIHI